MGEIFVLAGPNGAGKSSVLGSIIEAEGLSYFNPDSVARQLKDQFHLSSDQANSMAWEQMVELLGEAGEGGADFSFESTLGGRTVTRLLREACAKGTRVKLAYVALESPELHIARVSARVRAGGHPIPETDIRKRYASSPQNVCQLLPFLSRVWIFDNSLEAAPATPELYLRMEDQRILECVADDEANEWAVPILRTARQLDPSWSGNSPP